MARQELLEHFIRDREENGAATEAAIRAHRMGDISLHITDENGAPVEGATVTIRQTSHAFKIGANIFMLDGFESEEKNEAYKERFLSAFNMATVPFYWNTLEPEQGKPRYEVDSPYIYRRPTPDACIAFCEEHGIEPREHALAYEQHFPKWLSGMSVEQVKELLEARFAEISRRYAHRIPNIEVTNEMFWDNGITSFYFAPDYMPWCYEMAQKYFPNNCIGFNDNWCWRSDSISGWGPSYLQVEKLLNMGTRIDQYGMQYHMFFTREEEARRIREKHMYEPAHLRAVMDAYAKMIPHLSITEITIPSYSWEPEDEQFQADVIEYLYTLWFAHPAVDQIIYWNLVDGYGWNAQPGEMNKGENYYHGGLLRFDLSPKPAFERICYLFGEKWRTNETLISAGGDIACRGFYGDYEVTITYGDKTVTQKLTLDKAAGSCHVDIQV